jgi:hypothetical protein
MGTSGLEVRVKSLEETQRADSERTREDIATLREDIAATNRHMRVLHEDVVSRIEAIEHG